MTLSYTCRDLEQDKVLRGLGVGTACFGVAGVMAKGQDIVVALQMIGRSGRRRQADETRTSGAQERQIPGFFELRRYRVARYPKNPGQALQGSSFLISLQELLL